jgi:hypothetical protein
VPERSGDLASALRAIGGMLLALGALLVFIRRSAHHGWSDFELLLTVAVPAGLLFGMSVAGRSSKIRVPAAPWRAVLLVSAILLSVVSLFQFLQWAGASPQHLLYDAGVLVVTAAIAVFGARRAGAPYAFLPAGLALLIAWMLVWLKIIHDPSADTVRWLLLAGGGVLLAAALAMALLDAPGAPEIITAGGVGVVAAGIQGVLVGSAGLLGGLVSGGAAGGTTREVVAASSLPAASRPPVAPEPIHIAGAQTTGWNIYLLVVSLALVWSGSRSGARGPGYVGTFGLALFLISVGTQLTRLEASRGSSSSVLGWPLVLVLLGVAGLLAPTLARRGRRGPGGEPAQRGSAGAV